MTIFPSWVHEAKRNLGPWLTRLMEPGVPYGRFRHTPKALVGANIVSSAYAVNLHRYLNLLPLSDVARSQWWQWMQSMQNPETGLFIDPVLENHLPDVERHGRSALWNHRRYTTKMAHSAMLLLGRPPLYQMPQESLDFDPEKESIEEHLASFDWHNDPWSGASAAASTLAFIDIKVRRGQHEMIPIIHRGIEWLEAQQDPTTGLWGHASCHRRLRINSALKVITRLFSTFRRPLQYPERIIDSVLENWQDTEYFNVANPDLNACDEMNTLVLAAIAQRFTNHRRDEIQDMARQRIDWLRIFQRGDSGFSLQADGSIRKLNDIVMSHGEDQGDIHGLTLVGNALALIADILGATDELGWRFHGFYYEDWLPLEGEYEPTWEVVDFSTYRHHATSIERPSCRKHAD